MFQRRISNIPWVKRLICFVLKCLASKRMKKKRSQIEKEKLHNKRLNKRFKGSLIKPYSYFNNI